MPQNCHLGLENTRFRTLKVAVTFNIKREPSGSMVGCLIRDRGATGLSLTGVTVLWSLSKTHYPSLALVQPRKNRPCLTETFLMGRKESNQTNKNHFATSIVVVYQLDKL